MLDQSFSAENFRKILDFENRKGKNLEKLFFPDVFKITLEISEINKKIRSTLRQKPPNNDVLQGLISEKANKKKEKDNLLDKALADLGNILSKKDFKFPIQKIEREEEKPVYVIENTAVHFFAQKQLQYNIKRAFKVKQASRFTIVDQVKNLLT